jgi:hypothetical protein
MKTSNKSFWELINDYKINIPIIQRDYAQGREEEFDKREKFLSTLYSCLTNNSSLDLDFIYGRIKDQVFYPIDGQQRLTTLFLLHWYYSIKENITDDSRRVLQKFVYDTRISSREFCGSLISETIEIPSDNNIDFINEIQNKHWFRNSWKKDPTIKAMLVMIQAIHQKFNQINEPSIWKKLTEVRLITFQVLDLGAKGFDLTDELYIKMNSRGKQLTPFENFKANFIQFLDRHYTHKTLEHPIKGKISYSGYFSYKIEKEWTDLLWAYRGDKSTIDIEFTNYFEFVAQLCFFKNNKDSKTEDFKNSFNQFEEIFNEEQNLLYLFNSLDKLYQIFSLNGSYDRNNIDLILNTLFVSETNINQNTGAVNLFWNTTNDGNLFEMILSKGKNEDARNKVIFYCLLHYLIKHNLTVSEDGLKNYLRVLRNLIQASRQRNETKYNTNFRINDFGNYFMLFEQLSTPDVYATLHSQALNNKGTRISDSSLSNEKVKADLIFNNNGLKKNVFELEEFHYFGGLIHILEPAINFKKLNGFKNALKEIWDETLPDNLKIMALVANGFQGVFIKETKSMGELYYFGKNGNWSTILTNEEEEISNSVISLLNSYSLLSENSPSKKIQAIINDWFKQYPNDKSWKYYFLKYSEFTANRNYFAWENDFEIRMLGSEGSNPLLSFHINPYVLTVCRKINDSSICDENDCYHQYSVNFPLILKNGLTLSSTEDCWEINNNADILTPNIITKYNLKKVENLYQLKETDKMDRIEIAVDFIKNLTK